LKNSQKLFADMRKTIFRDLRAFALFARFLSANLLYNRANSPALSAGLHKLGALSKKRGFCLRRQLLNCFL